MSDENTRRVAPRSVPYWLDRTPAKCPALEAEITCDLAIVGGGFTGLWSAIKARARHPNANIVLLEADCLGNAASGRNGGFCAPSISHGVSNAWRAGRRRPIL
ncbi:MULTISPECIES: FAD-dependent oxidoreductase [unclassified Ruegeria]|uniref:FAD-dependent oxidoreductase n=1 Tax=unclassified Ruegeria TaxID=2625375 RepID=UPI001AE76040|nr:MULTISPECIES: FAD-dependent oxidoreductase [unclassified Ruegeria]